MMKIKGAFDTVEIALNNFCPLSCEGCPSLPLGHARSRELDALAILPLLQNHLLRRIVFCGNDGEPLEHSRIKEVLPAFGRAFPEAQIQVSTNGEKISELFDEEWPACLPQNILFEISVDGSRQEVHELTRKGANLDKVLSSISLLLQAGIQTRVVTTRHAENEEDHFTLAQTIKERFGLEVCFRDTSIVNGRILPPSRLSLNANVSVLYSETEDKCPDYVPNERHLFVNSNGDCYPCVSFVKYKTGHRPVNILEYSKASEFLSAFKKFSRPFCETYQKEGDKRQCRLNCGVFADNYRYDNEEDLKTLYD